MKTVHITDWRSKHEVLTAPMTEKELRDNVRKDGSISAKILIDFNQLVDEDIEWLNDEMSLRVTDSIAGLHDISYKLAGSTTNNEMIVRVDAQVEFENL